LLFVGAHQPLAGRPPVAQRDLATTCRHIDPSGALPGRVPDSRHALAAGRPTRALMQLPCSALNVRRVARRWAASRSPPPGRILNSAPCPGPRVFCIQPTAEIVPTLGNYPSGLYPGGVALQRRIRLSTAWWTCTDHSASRTLPICASGPGWRPRSCCGLSRPGTGPWCSAEPRAAAHGLAVVCSLAVTGFGDLQPDYPFKDNAARAAPSESSLGLFRLPRLRCRYILLYHTSECRSVSDQRQHLELSGTWPRGSTTVSVPTFTVPRP